MVGGIQLGQERRDEDFLTLHLLVYFFLFFLFPFLCPPLDPHDRA